MQIDLLLLLQIILYLSLIILVITFITLGIKLIKTLDKIDIVIKDVNLKMDKVDGVFNIIDRTTDFASSISDKVVNGVSKFVETLIKKKKGNDLDE